MKGVSPMTPKYHINLFWSEADGAWVADVPDLRSCAAFDDTRRAGSR
jgi:predicted RNase H-like HicB family nuclease